MKSSPLSPEILEKVRQVRDEQLSQQAILGALAYPVVFGFTVLPTGFYSRHPSVSQLAFAILLLLSTLRYLTCHNFPANYRGKEKAWRRNFTFLIASLGLTWGIITAYSVATEPWSPASLLFLFCGSGLAGGMLASIASYKEAYRAYLFGLLLPPGIIAFATVQEFGLVLGSFHVLYFGFLWLQGKRLTRSFLTSTLNHFTILEQRDELEEAMEKAKNANQAKSRLLANVSHELRTPLNTILGVTEWALDQKEQEAPPRDTWNEVHNAGLQLLDVVDQVLDFSKIESGQLSPAKQEAFSIQESLRQVQQLFARSSQAKGLQLLLQNQTPEELQVNGDSGRLRQILCNLIGNAVKFTKKGSITLECQWKEPQLLFRVKDTGPGIPDSYLDRLFEPFSQADDSSTREHGGTGLGLAISRDLARSLNGELSLESTSQTGSTFLLRINTSASSSPKPSKDEEAKPPLSYRVLVVDDDITNLGVANRQLAQMGLRVELASDAETAISLYRKQEFDFVLMDLQMPNIDGYSLARKLQLDPQALKPSTPILAFTAHTGDEEKSRCLEAGMVGFLNKPLRKSILRAELERLEKQRVLGSEKNEETLSPDPG